MDLQNTVSRAMEGEKFTGSNQPVPGAEAACMFQRCCLQGTAAGEKLKLKLRMEGQQYLTGGAFYK
ncbi:MAG: hypothetical protein U0U70_13145 [Chitinophagaceae bacterium]